MPNSSAPPFSSAEILGPEGLLAQSLPNYEFRTAQVQMAEVVADTMTGQKSALIEAGTGTGKTIAYLVPLISLGLRCVVSTGTKNLQTQILKKDIPLLERALKRKIKALSMKGRSNYLCLRRWRQFISHPGLAIGGLTDTLCALTEWIPRTKTGERSELEWLAEDHPLWEEICSTSDTCRGQKCENFGRCFVTKIRQEAARADIIVVNHHLLLADCSLRIRSKASAIPNYSRLIIDEAHILEQIATEYFGLAVSNRRLQELVGDIRREITDARIEDNELAGILEEVLKKSIDFFESIYTIEERFTINERIITQEVRDKLISLISSLGFLTLKLQTFTDSCEPLISCKRRAQEMESTLDFIKDHGDPEYVFWGERQGHFVSLKVSPIEISQQLSTHLFSALKGLVLTSATLSANKGFDYIRGRLGLTPAAELILESHFDYTKQAVIFIPAEMPSPSQEEFGDHLGPLIARILRLTQGRALVLFTSYKNLNKVYHFLKEEDFAFTLLKQGESLRENLLERFSTDISSVLLATSSFWQGVDVPGEALSCVIIDKLPFSVPTDPIVEARIQWISNRAGNPFREYQLPLAIITLKQGLGRLIRHREDRGLLVILDPRICTKSYGSFILKDLPNCPVVHTLDECTQYLAALNIFPSSSAGAESQKFAKSQDLEA